MYDRESIALYIYRMLLCLRLTTFYRYKKFKNQKHCSAIRLKTFSSNLVSIKDPNFYK